MKPLTQKDYADAAKKLGCETAAIRAVAEVESQGSGFLPDDSPKILFEGHQFWRELEKQNIDPTMHRHGNEDILYPNWERGHYKGGIEEYERLNKAVKINEEAAMRSASWGTFQIMGYHAETLGFKDVFDFTFFIAQSERNNLMVFVRFIKKNGLTRYIQALDWEGFAKRYNGPSYAKNEYDLKMDRAYKKYSA
ncbi:N-acetylmuramidase family protein [Flavobacteriaceae bacterium TK19130]|nr:N-acetylmuramidase family protein [Thermobacterium salinum]